VKVVPSVGGEETKRDLGGGKRNFGSQELVLERGVREFKGMINRIEVTWMSCKPLKI